MQELRLLGPVQVARIQDDAKKESVAVPVRFRSRRTAALLGYLAVERRPVAREYLAALFWPDETSATGRCNLRRELYNLTRVLPGCWQTDAQTVQFAPAAETKVDIDTWECLIAQQRWQEAAGLPCGEFLEGLYLRDNAEFENWLLSERARWHERTQMVLHSAGAELRRHGRYAEAIPYTRRLLRLAPWEEGSHRDLMRLLAWSGRREEAVRQFAICRQTLADELGIEPSPETIALFHSLRAGGLAPPPAPPAFVLAETPAPVAARPPFVHRDRELGWLFRHLGHAIAGQGGIVFLTGGSGSGKTALLDAFADAALAARPELLVARGNCSYGGAGDAYLPIRELMVMLSADVEARWAAGTISTELARRLWGALPLVTSAFLDHGSRLLDIFVSGPALLRRATAAGPDEARWLQRLREWIGSRSSETLPAEQSSLFEQFSNVLRAVAQKNPLLLILDDLQWADSASTDLLFHLVRRITQGGDAILVVCAYRPEEIMRERGAQPQLATALSEFRRQFGDVWLSLSWPNEHEGRRFVDALLACEPNRLDEEFRAALFRRTGGHPLFTVELLRSLRDQGHLVRDESGAWSEGPQVDWQMMPARVQAVIEARIRQLDPELQALLHVASVEGDVFTAQIAAQVQQMDERSLLHLLASDLDQQGRLVQEHEHESHRIGQQVVTRYRFRHAMFREYLYQQLSRGERRLLHGAVAAALEAVFAEDLDEVSVQLAQHFWRAGDNGRALHYFARAAANAAHIYAFDQAIAHYSRAIDLAGHAKAGEATLAGLYQGRGLAHAATGRFDPAFADLQAALECSSAASERQLEWQLLIELGKLCSSRDYSQALAMYQRALGLARDLDDLWLLACTLNCLGNWHANNENPAEALHFHQEALRIFEKLGDQPSVADTLDMLGIAQLLRGDYASGGACGDRAAVLFRTLGDDPRLVSSLIARALVAAGALLLALAPVSLPGDPFVILAEADQIARRIGSAMDEAWAAWAAALLHTVRGEYGPALVASRRGVRIATAIEHREWLVASLNAFATVHNELLQPQEALRELEQAMALAQDLRSPYWINHVTAALARSYQLLGELTAARRSLAAVLPRDTPMDTAGKRFCWARRAELALAMAEPELALDICERLVTSAPGLAPGAIIPFLWLLRGQALAAMGQVGEALDLLEDSASTARKLDQRFLLWQIHAALARLHLAGGRKQQGEQELALASALVAEMGATLPDEASRAAFTCRAAAALASHEC